MRAVAKVSIVVAAAAALAAIGGGVASAGWFVTSPRSTATVKTVRMPGFERGPAVEWQPKNSVTVRWADRRVQRYIVERHNTVTGAATRVCGDAVSTTGCQDTNVPAGTWTYTVRAANWRWTGPESPRSRPLTIRLPGVTSIPPRPSVSPTPEPSVAADRSKVDPSPSASPSPTADTLFTTPGNASGTSPSPDGLTISEEQ